MEETDPNSTSNLAYFQLRSTNSAATRVRSRPLFFGRFLIGSSDNCDIVVDHPSVNGIHCVLELFPHQKKIYDLSGEFGMLVNGVKTIVSEVKLKDKILIGSVELTFDNFYTPPDSPININSSSKPIPASNRIADKSNDEVIPPNFPGPKETLSTVKNVEHVKVPYLIYPFDQNYNFDTSEYIFEDNDTVYPIFHYTPNKFSLEVMVFFRKKVMSVDFVPPVKGQFYLTGVVHSEPHVIEFPVLAPDEKVDFLECRDGEFYLTKLQNFKMKIFSNSPSKSEQQIFKVEKQDIVQFESNDLQVIVRYVESPPLVDHPPALSRDKYIFWLFSSSIFLLGLLSLVFSSIDVKKEQIAEDKAPERIATILLKKNTPKQPPKMKASDTLKLPSDKLEDKTKSQTENPKPEPVISLNDKIPKNQKPVKKGAPSKAGSGKTAQNAQSNKSNKKVTSSSVTPKSSGQVDVYKGGTFASTVSSLVAKGGKYPGVKSEGFGQQVGVGTQGVKGSGGPGINTATVSDQLGDVSGTAKGVNDFSYGTKGLVKGKQFYSASIPAETVVVGLMDPDIILKILREHLPQFRYCYQREIESRQENIQGIVKLSFLIGASGNVTKAGVINDSNIPSEIKKCIINVLYGIQFPKLRSEGVVEVVQPFSFYANK